MKRGKGSQFIYFVRIRGTEFLKIGRSGDPARRLEALKSSVPFELELVGILKEAEPVTEIRLHERFKELRVRGEWFREVGELSEFVSSMPRETGVATLPEYLEVASV
jgi:hypothetical protein